MEVRNMHNSSSCVFPYPIKDKEQPFRVRFRDRYEGTIDKNIPFRLRGQFHCGFFTCMHVGPLKCLDDTESVHHFHLSILFSQNAAKISHLESCREHSPLFLNGSIQELEIERGQTDVRKEQQWIDTGEDGVEARMRSKNGSHRHEAESEDDMNILEFVNQGASTQTPTYIDEDRFVQQKCDVMEGGNSILPTVDTIEDVSSVQSTTVLAQDDRTEFIPTFQNEEDHLTTRMDSECEQEMKYLHPSSTNSIVFNGHDNTRSGEINSEKEPFDREVDDYLICRKVTEMQSKTEPHNNEGNKEGLENFRNMLGKYNRVFSWVKLCVSNVKVFEKFRYSENRFFLRKRDNNRSNQSLRLESGNISEQCT